VTVIPALVIIGLGVLTFRQVPIWRNSVELWEHAVRLDGQSHFALFNLAKAYEDQKCYDDAVHHLRRALEVRPAAIDPRRNLGILLADKLQQFDAAIAEFQLLARQQPQNPEPYYCIGLSRSRQQRHQQAVRSFLIAVRLQPDHQAAHQALSDSYARLGNRSKSVEHDRIAQRLGRPGGRR
jgi:tetratricopeptide (TPR) repeat protein